MKVVALLTDFGLKDNFVGVIKGVILNINSHVQLIDISHSVRSYNTFKAAILLENSFTYFPKETVFLTVIDPGVGSGRKAVAIKTKNYYFVGPDNGVLSLAAQTDGIEKIVHLTNRHYFLKNISFTFQARDIFAPAAAYITKGINISVLGKGLKTIEKIKLPQPKIKGAKLEAQIIYADKFGNLITNITKEQFMSFIKKKNFIASINGKKIKNICSYYSQAKTNQPFFIEASTSLLEVSLKNKSAKDYFSLKKEALPKLIVKRLLPV